MISPEAKSELRDLALDVALAKLQMLANVQAHLRAAMQQCVDWQNGHHTFDTTEIGELRERIWALSNSIPSYNREVFAALTGRAPDAFDYINGNDVLRLRHAEARSRGIETDDDDLPPDEDPLALYARLKED